MAPLATLAPIIGAAIGGGATLTGAALQSRAQGKSAKAQTQSANYAADLEAQGAREALAFQREQARLDQARWEATQQANYEQWASREGRMGSLGMALGLSGRQIPPYRSTTSGGGGGSSTSNPAVLQQAYEAIAPLQSSLSPTSGSLDDILRGLGAAGIQATRATHAGGTLPSDDKIVLPGGQIIDLIADVGGSGARWAWQPETGQAAPSARRTGASPLSQPLPYQTGTATPPQSLRTLLWRS